MFNRLQLLPIVLRSFSLLLPLRLAPDAERIGSRKGKSTAETQQPSRGLDPASWHWCPEWYGTGLG